MCKFRPHGFGLQKTPPKWHFFAILGLRMGLFWGVNGALVVIHLKGCITTTGGTLLIDFKRKMRENIVKNGNVVFLHTFFWLYLGLSGCQIAPP